MSCSLRTNTLLISGFFQDLQLTVLKGIIDIKKVLPIDGWPVFTNELGITA